MTSPHAGPSATAPRDPSSALGPGWTSGEPDEGDAAELTDLLRHHEEAGRGWAGSSQDALLVQVSAQGYLTRENVVLRDEDGAIRGWASAHDRAAGRMLLVVVVDRLLVDAVADRVAGELLSWADVVARRIGLERGLASQQVDTGAFADDERQHRWLADHGYCQVRTWWQMTRKVTSEEVEEGPPPRAGARIRPVARSADGMPDQDDLRAVHEVLEDAFADHFNSHAETFDEFLARLREDPGHRWDHWWIAELLEQGTEPAGALVASAVEGSDGSPGGSHVEYIGVTRAARGRGLAKSLLRTAIADAAERGRDHIDLEVDADSPTGADALYLSLGWVTTYVTTSWHRDVAVGAGTRQEPV